MAPPLGCNWLPATSIITSDVCGGSGAVFSLLCILRAGDTNSDLEELSCWGRGSGRLAGKYRILKWRLLDSTRYGLVSICGVRSTRMARDICPGAGALRMATSSLKAAARLSCLSGLMLLLRVSSSSGMMNLARLPCRPL